MQDEFEGIRAQVRRNPARGFVSRRGRTGRVVDVDAGLVVVLMALGSLRASISPDTALREYQGEVLPSSAPMEIGAVVKVTEQLTASGDEVAVEIIREGEGRHDVHPGTARVARLLLSFP